MIKVTDCKSKIEDYPGQSSIFNLQSSRQRIRLAMLVAVLVPALVSCGSGGATSAPTPDPKFAAITIVSSQTRLLGGDISVVGTVKNGDAAAHDITLHVSFLDPSSNEIAKAEGVAEDVGPGGTGPFKIDGKVDPAKYSTMQVTVVSLGEKK